MPCRSYRMLNLLMNWFMLLHVLVMVPRYAMRPTSLHCCRRGRQKESASAQINICMNE